MLSRNSEGIQGIHLRENVCMAVSPTYPDTDDLS